MSTYNRKICCSLQQGFMIIEAIVVTAVLVSLIGLGSRYITRNAERTINQITAKQLQQVTQASQQYVQDNYQSFKNNTDEKINIQKLIDKNYLSAVFFTKDQGNENYKNHYGQTYNINIIPNEKEENLLLQVLITTENGRTINEQSLREISALAGSAAGYISILDENKVTGNHKSWSIDLEEIENADLQPGHLASLTIVNEKEVMNATEFLRRQEIKNHPEYNQMDTDLKIKESKKIIWDYYGRLKPEEGEVNVSTISQMGINLGTHATDKLDDFWGSSMVLNRNSLTFDNIWSKNKTIGKLKINSGHIKNSNELNIISPSILIESAGKVPGVIHLVANSTPSITLNNSKEWLTEIKPSEITLEKQENGDKSYLRNDKLVYSNKSSHSSILDGYGVVAQDKGYPQKYNLDLEKSLVRSKLTGSGVALPIFRFMKTEVSPTRFANSHCKGSVEDGSLFIVDSQSIGSTLFYCCNGSAKQVLFKAEVTD